MRHPLPQRFDRPDDVRLGQLTIDDLGTDLSRVTFVVVDLETTGASNGDNDITEIGAVKTRGGELLGEFSTLVKPEGNVISPFVERLTGISNGMVVDAPPITSVLPAFLEFAHSTVLVAHNAGFDMGFLRRACAAYDYPWPNPIVLDTVKLARMAVGRDEVRNHKLSTLAEFFATTVDPNHRALSDARATSEILFHLFDRFGTMGITTLEELRTLKPAGWKRRNSKISLAADVPHGPGVYLFLDGASRVLYVGQSRDMHTRVRNYFGTGETRGRMNEMVTAAQSVSTVPCATTLEAQVREVRLISDLAPPYNRKSKHPERQTWLRLTDGDFPRLSLVRTQPPDASQAAGPFRSHHTAVAAKSILESIFPLKRCTQRPGSASFSPCPASQLGKCGGPCAGELDPAGYDQGIAGLSDFLRGDPTSLIRAFRTELADVVSAQRYEKAADLRDGLVGLLGACSRAEQRRGLREITELAAASPRPEGGWDIGLVREGRLAGAAVSPRGVNPYGVLRTLQLTAEHVDQSTSTLPEETALISAWLTQGDTRLITSTGPWASPVRGVQQALSALRVPRRAAAETR